MNIERRTPAFAFPIPRMPTKSQIDLRALVRGIVRRKRLIAVSILLCLGAGVTFLLYAKPVFTAEGMLLIDARRQVQPLGMSGRSSGSPDILTLDSAAVDSQVEILKADQMSRDVIAKLGLSTNPAFLESSFATSALTTLRQWIRGPVEPSDDIPLSVMKAFADRLDVKRVRETYMIAIHFKSTVPALAASVTNAVMQTYLDREREGRRNAIKVEMNWLDERLGELRENIAKTDAALRQAAAGSSTSMDIGKLQREVESNRAIYQVFLDRYTSSVQQMSFPFAQASIVAGARTPQEKSFPNTSVLLVLSILGGLAIGIGLATYLDLTDDSFRTSQQAEAAIGRPVFGVLPAIDQPATAAATGIRASITASPAKSRYRYIIDKPMSRYAEAMRGLRNAVDTHLDGHANRVIGFTSALSNEDAETVAANFAQLLARSGKSVLLVDADFREKKLTSAIRPAGNRDLLDILWGRSSIADATQSLVNRLMFIGCNRLGKPNEPARELDMTAIQHFLDQATLEYDYVVVNLPAIAPLSDLQAFAPAVGNLALVVKWGATSQRAVRHILSAVPNVRDRIVGVVLCDVDIRRFASDTEYPLTSVERSTSGNALFLD